MEATLTAVQLQIRLLAGLVEEILADEPASVVGDVAAAPLGLLALLQAEEELGLVARTTGLAQVVRGARQGTGCATRGILSEAAASSTYPVLVPPELYKNPNDSVFRGDIVADSAANDAYHSTSSSRRTRSPPEKEEKDSNVREDSRKGKKNDEGSKVRQSSDRPRIPRSFFMKAIVAYERTRIALQASRESSEVAIVGPASDPDSA